MFFEVSMLSFFFVICDSMYSPIGNYSHVIKDYTNLCGISKNSLRDESNCFEYHRDFSSSLESARNLEFGEAPWTVIVAGRTEHVWGLWSTHRYSCGGVLISYQWVLTAAHCVTADFNRIYFDLREGNTDHYIDSERVIPHPLYSFAKPEYDIALIKLERSFDVYNQTDYYHQNFICLSVKNITIQGKELAMISGRGPHFTHMQIGPASVLRFIYDRMDHHRLIFNPADGSPIACKGDSGSPIWKYFMGRAYLIGILSQVSDPGSDGCGTYGMATYVPYFVDWILETIK